MAARTRSATSPPSMVLCIIATMYISACGSPPDTPSPVAKIVAKMDTAHKDIRIDNYSWLNKKSEREVLEYLKAENVYTDAKMKHTEAFQERLYKELLGRIKETDFSVPEKIDDYYYYTRTEEGQQYTIHCRKKGSLEAPEEILLNQNLLATGRDYFRIGVFEISPNHQLLAYSVDTTGSETFTLYVKDLKTGDLLSDVILNTYYSVEWASDNQTLFYNVLDDTKRPYKLYRHRLGTDSKEDALVYHEEDESFFLSVSKTKSKEYLTINLGSITTSEIHFLKADSPTGDFKVVHPRKHELEYSIEHHGDRFYILTNDRAKNFRLMQVAVRDPSKKNWREVIPHRDSAKIDALDVFKEHLVVYEREYGLKKIRITNVVTNETHYVEFPEPVYTFWPAGNKDFNVTSVRFSYMSLVTPRSVFDYDMNARTRELKKQFEVLGGYDPALYQSERIFATASDGTKIPISMVYKKGVVKGGQNPLYLYGYGSYGTSIDPSFSSNRLSLLDRGFIYAIAHVRGGGEMGRSWYEAGKLLNKKNTFTDFTSCAEHLIDEGYTASDKLIISGGSAGGLLLGAVTNMRPDLFKAVIAKVPFVDIINTMLDPSIPLTVVEYEEWGNPNEKKYYDYIKSYSPYDNVEAKDYPNMLITAGLNDPRVQYWEPAKWTAKLRALKTDNNVLLLKTNMDAGHSGPSGRYEYLKEIAFEYAFIFDVFGIKE